MNWMRMLLGVLLAGVVGGVAQQSSAGEGMEAIALWPGTAPGDTEGFGAEKDLTGPKDGLIAGKPVIRLGNVSKPTITVHRPPRDKQNGAAVLVCPGGGYHILAMDLEGSEVVEWLNSVGVTGILLKYRVPARKGRPRHEAPLQDAQRAMGIVRQRAAEWGINPRRVGVMGFSAGAHLSAALSCQGDRRTYEPVDAADQGSSRPDFTMLIYPAYLTVQKEGDKVAPELTITSNTPPCFLVQTQDDVIRVESSLFYYLGLKQAGVQSELHLYAAGGHGYGLRSTREAVTGWPRLAERWMRGLGVLDPGK